MSRILTSSNSNSTFFPSTKNTDSTNFVANPAARMIHSASLSRVRPPVAASAVRRPATTANSKAPPQFAHSTVPRAFTGGSAPTSARTPSRDTGSGDDNEGYGQGYRCDNVSSKSTGRTPSGSGDRGMRSRSKEPTHRTSPPIVKREGTSGSGRQREIDNKELTDSNNHSNSNSNSNSTRSNSAIDYEEDEGKWLCPKCGHDNSNQYHCDHCATKRSAYSFAPENVRLQRQLPR